MERPGEGPGATAAPPPRAAGGRGVDAGGAGAGSGAGAGDLLAGALEAGALLSNSTGMEGLLEDAVEVGALAANASVAGVGALTNASSEEILVANGSAAADLLAEASEAAEAGPALTEEELEAIIARSIIDINREALDAATALMNSAAGAVLAQGPEVFRAAFLADPTAPLNGTEAGRAGLAMGLQLAAESEAGGEDGALAAIPNFTAPDAVAELCSPLSLETLESGTAPPPVGVCSVLRANGDEWEPLPVRQLESREGDLPAFVADTLKNSTDKAFNKVDDALWPLRRLAADGALVLENMTTIYSNGTVVNYESGSVEPSFSLEVELENSTTLAQNFFCSVQGLDESGESCRTVTPADGLIQAMYINIALGALCVIGFGILRGWIKVYRARLLSPATSVKPKPLPLGGFRQLWSWVIPVLSQSEIEMLESAGMDAVMLCRFLMFCAQLFVPTAIVFCAVILPVNTVVNVYRCETPQSPNEDLFLRLSLDNACDFSPLLWIHAVFVYIFCGWGAFLLYQHYVAFAGLRHFHMSCYSPYNSWQARNIPSAKFGSRKKTGKPHGSSGQTAKLREERGLRAKFAEVQKTPGQSSIGPDTHSAGSDAPDMENISLEDDTPPSATQMMSDIEPSASSARTDGGPSKLRMKSLFMQVFHPKRFVDAEGTVPDELRQFAEFQKDYAKGYRASATDMKANLAGRRYISPRTQRIMQQEYQAELSDQDPTGFVTPSPYGMAVPQDTIDEFMQSEAQLKAPTAPEVLRRESEEFSGLDSPSMAVQKWWEFRETGGEEQRQMIMVKPSVRHVKWVNAEVDDRLVSVGAENYAVLVMDVPHKSDVTNVTDGPFESIFTPRTGFDKMKKTVLGRKKSIDVSASGSGEHMPVSSRVITISQHIRKNSHDDSGIDGLSARSPIYKTPRADDASVAAETDTDGDIAAEAFRGLFPEDFKEVVVAKDFRPVTRALYRWDNAAKKLEGLYAREALTGKKVMMKTGFLGLRGERVEAVKFWEDRVRQCQDQIKEERRAAIQGPPAPSRIVLFKSQEVAAISAQSTLFPIDGSMFHVLRAPGPDDIYWPTLMMSSKERTLRKALLMPLIAFIMILPSGILAGVVSILQLALCGGDKERGINSKVYWEAYCYPYTDEERPFWVTLIQKILLTWLPPVFLTLWQIVLMRVLYYIAAAEGRSIALSMIDRRIMSLYFYWDFFNVFLGGVIGSAGISILMQEFNKINFNEFLLLFGRAIMSNSNFFISYVSLRALLMIPFKLLFPHPAVLCWTLRNLLSKTYCCATRCNLTFRDKYVIWAPKSFLYGKETGIFLLIAMMGAIYAVSAPIILLFTAVYFTLAFIVFKHHLLYVYGRAYESGGIYWPILFTRIVVLLISMACLTGVQMIIKKALWPAIAVIPCPFLLLFFLSACNKKFHNQVNFVPLEIAKAMPKADVPRDLYVAPELRKESAGWHPESGKAWQGYGIPMWTL